MDLMDDLETHISSQVPAHVQLLQYQRRRSSAGLILRHRASLYLAASRYLEGNKMHIGGPVRQTSFPISFQWYF